MSDRINAAMIFNFTEEERQATLLALAVLTLRNPGLHYHAGTIAKKLHGYDMFESFRELRRDIDAKPATPHQLPDEERRQLIKIRSAANVFLKCAYEFPDDMPACRDCAQALDDALLTSRHMDPALIDYFNDDEANGAASEKPDQAPCIANPLNSKAEP